VIRKQIKETCFKVAEVQQPAFILILISA